MSPNQLQIIQAQLDALMLRMGHLDAGAMDSDKYEDELDSVWEEMSHLLADLDGLTKPGSIEATLSQAQIMYRVIGDIVPDFLWSCTADIRLLYSNDRCTEYSGLEPFCGEPVNTLIHPDDFRRVEEAWEKTVESQGREFKSEFRMRGKDGVYHWFMSRAVPIRDNQGDIVQWIGTTTDIHERKIAEEALDRSYEHVRQIIETAIDAVISMDSDGLITGWNAQAEAMFGWMRHEVIGEPFLQTVIAPHLAEDYLNPLRCFLESSQSKTHKERFEVCAYHRSGREFPVELSVSCAPAGDSYVFNSFARDLTERRQFEDEISLSEDRFRATFEQAAVGIAHLATDGRWLRVNDKLCDMLGYSKAELLTLNFTDVTHQEDVGVGPTELMQLLSGEIDNCVLEKRYRRKDGKTVWGMVTATVIRDLKQDPQYIISVIEDITERKEAERALQKSLRILSTAEKVANLGSWEFDLRTNTISRSDELCRIIGVAESSQDASLDHIVDMVHPDDRPTMSVLMRDAVQNRKSFICKYRCIRPDRREIVLSVRGEPIQNEDSEVIRLIGSTQDVTLQEETNRFLAQRSRMSALIADVGDALIRDTNLKRTLKRCGEAVVYRLEAVVVRIWTVNFELNALALQTNAGMSTSIDASLAPKLIDIDSEVPICRLAANRKSYFSNNIQREDWLQDKELARGESITSYAGLPLIVNNVAVGLLEIFSRTAFADIEIDTIKLVADAIAVGIQRRNAENELQMLNLELERRVVDRTVQIEAAIKELDAFAYSVSHDLRAPLRSIDGFSQALIKEFQSQIPDKARLYLDRVRSGAQRMGRLIDDLLALSHIGRQDINLQSTDIAFILDDVVSELQLKNSDRQVEIIAADLPTCICDPGLIRRVFANLLSNSFKFTKSRITPRIDVSYHLEREEHIFTVQDNGIGFEMQYAHKIFEPFQRLHRAEDFDGSGVGLAIVQRIVTLHDGRVWAESRPDNGAAFYFTLHRRTSDE